jgi:hypothetical protein
VNPIPLKVTRSFASLTVTQVTVSVSAVRAGGSIMLMLMVTRVVMVMVRVVDQTFSVKIRRPGRAWRRNKGAVSIYETRKRHFQFLIVQELVARHIVLNFLCPPKFACAWYELYMTSQVYAQSDAFQIKREGLVLSPDSYSTLTIIKNTFN